MPSDVNLQLQPDIQTAAPKERQWPHHLDWGGRKLKLDSSETGYVLLPLLKSGEYTEVNLYAFLLIYTFLRAPDSLYC